MIAANFLSDVRTFQNAHRGLRSCTGSYADLRVSVTTSGMGGASTGVVLPEAVRSGARIFIRVGSCGGLIRQMAVGDPVIVTAAIRFDGASENWAPMEYPAVADWRVVVALAQAAHRVVGDSFWSGIEATTSDFNTGQGRPNLFQKVPPRMADRHREVMRLGAACYSMEAATLFVWCTTEGGGLPAGAINAVYANRLANAFEAKGDETAAHIALEALSILARQQSMGAYLNGQPIYPK